MLQRKNRRKWTIHLGALLAITCLSLGGRATPGLANEYEASEQTAASVLVAENSSEDKWSFSLSPVRNTTYVNLVVDDYSSLLASDSADELRVTAAMSYRGKTTREVVKSLSLSEFDSETSSVDIDFGDYGKFAAKIEFLRNDTVVHESDVVTVGVVADTYNIAPVSATLPVTLFSLNMWGGDNIRQEGPVILMMERPNAYNWDELPVATDGLYGAYGVPLLTQDELRYQPGDFGAASDLFRSRYQVMADYVHDLLELDSTSKVNLYCVDLYCGLVQNIIYANKIPDDQYTITLLSDGSYTPNKFASVYNSSDNESIHASLVSAWSAAKQHAYDSGSVDSGFEGASAGNYLWALVDSEPNAKLWVARKDLIKTTSDGDAFGTAIRANSKLVQVSIGTLLKENIQASDQNTAEFKALYNFNDGYFSEAEESGKEVMLFLGTRVTGESNFTDYARFVMSYYGDEYAYYYKGHPATPTDLYPEKQQQLEELGITDVDASIAAELILFFNPEIYLSGYGSTTYASVPEGMAKGMFNMTKEAGLQKLEYSNMDFWMSEAGDSTPDALKSLCVEGHSCYIVEFSDMVAAQEGYDVAIWDASGSVIIYYKAQDDGTYVKVKEDDGATEKSAISSGTYIIQSSLENGKVIDVEAGSSSEGANVQLWTYNSTNAQKWEVEVDESTGLAIIRNVGSGKLLDVSGGKTGSGTNVWQYSSNGSNAQRWRIVSSGNGTVKVVSALDSGYVLDVSGASSWDGSNVQVWADNGSDAQSFVFLNVNPVVSSSGQADLEDGYYRITTAINMTSSLDVKDWSQSNGTGIQIWSSTSKENQIFKITKQKSGFYRIENAWSGKSLDLTDGTFIPGTKVQQWTSSQGNANQEWSISSKTGGSFTIQNVATGLMLDVAGGNIANGTQIQGYTANGTQSQRWLIASSSAPGETAANLATEYKDVLADGIYVVESNLSANLVLDVAGASSENGANIQLYNVNLTNAQRWIVSHDDNGFITFTSVASGKALDVTSGSRSWGANVQQYTPNETQAQKWVVVPQTDGGYAIISALSPDLALDIAGGTAASGANVQVHLANGTTAQTFSFLKLV